MAIRVLLVDEHSVVRQGLRMFLGLDPEIDVVREGVDGAEGLRLARAMPRCGGDGSPDAGEWMASRRAATCGASCRIPR